jgi:hypothetical protein
MPVISSQANFLMTFAEFYLAYKFAADRRRADIILLDRSVMTEAMHYLLEGFLIAFERGTLIFL